MVATFASLSPPIPTFFSSFRSQPSFPLSVNLPPLPSNKPIICNDPFLVISPSSTKLRRIHAAPQDSAVVETVQEVVSTADDGVSTVISALLFVAFIGLSMLTLGVIYLGVTDFLQKREKEKFEKEESAKSGKKKKKKKVRGRAGPKGFGQKIDEDDEDDD